MILNFVELLWVFIKYFNYIFILCNEVLFIESVWLKEINNFENVILRNDKNVKYIVKKFMLL